MTEEKQLNGNIQQLLSNLDNLMFVRLFRSFNFAAGPSKMLIAFIAVVGLGITGVVMDIATNSVAKTSYSSSYSPAKDLYGYQPHYMTELDIYLSQPQKLEAFIESKSTKKTYQGVYKTCWDFSTKKFNKTVVSLLSFRLPQAFRHIADCVGMAAWALRHHTIYSIIYITVAISILGLCGGAICRSVALEYTIKEKPGLGESLRFSKKNLKNLIFAPAAPFLLCLFLGLLLILLGIVANMPWVGDIILGVLMLVALVIGFFITTILIGAIGSVSMMMPAIAYEGTDSYDAIGRTYCYTFSKPWKLVFYGFISMFYGGICYLLVRFIAFLILKSTYSFLNIGMFVESAKDKGLNKLTAIWPEPEFFNLLGNDLSRQLSFTESFSFLLVYLSVLLITAIVAAFCISYFFSSSTIIYSLMRKCVDKTDTDEIFLGKEKLQDSWDKIASQQKDKIESPQTSVETPAESSDKGKIETSNQKTSSDDAEMPDDETDKNIP